MTSCLFNKKSATNKAVRLPILNITLKVLNISSTKDKPKIEIIGKAHKGQKTVNVPTPKATPDKDTTGSFRSCMLKETKEAILTKRSATIRLVKRLKKIFSTVKLIPTTHMESRLPGKVAIK